MIPLAFLSVPFLLNEISYTSSDPPPWLFLSILSTKCNFYLYCLWYRSASCPFPANSNHYHHLPMSTTSGSFTTFRLPLPQLYHVYHYLHLVTTPTTNATFTRILVLLLLQQLLLLQVLIVRALCSNAICTSLCYTFNVSFVSPLSSSLAIPSIECALNDICTLYTPRVMTG